MALGAKQLYLFTYNALLASGWGTVFLISLVACATEGYSAVYQHGSYLTKVLIYLSILETFHAAFLVRSGVMSNLLQWVARAHALLLVVDAEPSVHKRMGAAAMILAWSFGESTRYPSCDPGVSCTSSSFANKCCQMCDWRAVSRHFHSGCFERSVSKALRPMSLHSGLRVLFDACCQECELHSVICGPPVCFLSISKLSMRFTDCDYFRNLEAQNCVATTCMVHRFVVTTAECVTQHGM
jgi:Protein tyrosine phosphatase-like protein, PTPLA